MPNDAWRTTNAGLDFRDAPDGRRIHSGVDVVLVGDEVEVVERTLDGRWVGTADGKWLPTRLRLAGSDAGGSGEAVLEHVLVPLLTGVERGVWPVLPPVTMPRNPPASAPSVVSSLSALPPRVGLVAFDCAPAWFAPIVACLSLIHI